MITSLEEWVQSRKASWDEDVLQESAVRLLRREKEGPPVQDLGAFMDAIARNVQRERMRLRRREVQPSGFENLVDKMPSPDSPVPEVDPALVDEVLARLPLHKRELLLSYYEDGGYRSPERRQKLADELGKEQGTLRVTIWRLKKELQSLRRLLSGEKESS